MMSFIVSGHDENEIVCLICQTAFALFFERNQLVYQYIISGIFKLQEL